MDCNRMMVHIGGRSFTPHDSTTCSIGEFGSNQLQSQSPLKQKHVGVQVMIEPIPCIENVSEKVNSFSEQMDTFEISDDESQSQSKLEHRITSSIESEKELSANVIHQAILISVKENDNIVIDTEDDVEFDKASNSECDHTNACESDEDNESNVNVSSLCFPMTSPDGTIWHGTPQSSNQPNNRVIHIDESALNNVNLISGRTLKTPRDVFDCLFDDSIIDLIVDSTNTEAKNAYKCWRSTDKTEIRALIGLLISAGLERGSKTNYAEFFHKLHGQPLFRAAIGVNRFKKLLRYIRFDSAKTRHERRERDKLAAVRELFDSINCNLQRLYSPGKHLTFGEQFLAFDGKCPFKHYISGDTNQCGMRIFWLCDSENSYPLNAVVHLGKNNTNNVNSVNIRHQMARQLCQPYENSGRVIALGKYFTSYKLSQELLSHGLPSLGIVGTNHYFVPQQFQNNQGRKAGSNVFGFNDGHTLLSHMTKRNKLMIFLSTLQQNPCDIDETKSEMIKFYNNTRKAVSSMDECCQTFSCERATKRWPFALFTNLINVCGVAAFIIHNGIHGDGNSASDFTRKQFLTELSDELAFDQIVKRGSVKFNKSHLSSKTVQCGITANKTDRADDFAPIEVKKRRCRFCPSKIDRKTKTLCTNCRRNVCKEHSKMTIICVECNANK